VQKKIKLTEVTKNILFNINSDINKLLSEVDRIKLKRDQIISVIISQAGYKEDDIFSFDENGDLVLNSKNKK
jgi:hypothetical protein